PLEGQPIGLRQVVFHGQEALSESELLAVVHDALGESATPARAQTTTAQIDEAGLTGRVRVASGVAPVPADQVWNEEAWGKVPEALQHAYREAGFLEAQVGSPQLDIDDVRRTAVVTVPITEGRRTVVAAISFPGAD